MATWMLDTREYGGCTAMNFVIKKSSSMCDDYLLTVAKFLVSGFEMNEFFINKTFNCFKNLVTYFCMINDLVYLMPKYFQD